MKGTGMLSIIKKGKQSTVLIDRSPEMESLEMSLKKLIGNYKNATDMTNKIPKVPEEPKQFVPGPAIRPSGPLLRWLDETVGMRVRLPVIVRWPLPHHYGFGAFIGTVKRVDDETIYLNLIDLRMGFSPFDHMHQRCSKSETACAVWLEGYWDGGRAASLPGAFGFRVVEVHELIEATTDEMEVHAQSESPSP